MKKENKIELVYSCKFYDDEIDECQELIVGQIENGLFTGMVEHGGRYINTYFYLKGKEIDIDEVGGYDICEGIVFENNPKLGAFCDEKTAEYILFDDEYDAHPRRDELALADPEELYFYNKDMHGRLSDYLIDSFNAIC